MNHSRGALRIVFGILFAGGVALALLGRILCTRSWKDYALHRPESCIPDVIETVLWDEDLDRLCVCYNDANLVNVYTSEGTFLWSVGTPWMRNSEFELLDGTLVIFQDEAYRYDARDGAFLGKTRAEELPLTHAALERKLRGDDRVGPYTFDANQVYRTAPDGTRTTVVARPRWHALYHGTLWLGIAFFGAAGLGLCLLLEKRRLARAAREGERALTFESREARFLRNYYRAVTLVQGAFALANLPAACFVDWFQLGLIPLALHFIVSGWVLSDRVNRLVCRRAERAAVELWQARSWATLILAALSMLAAIGLILARSAQ